MDAGASHCLGGEVSVEVFEVAHDAGGVVGLESSGQHVDALLPREESTWAAAAVSERMARRGGLVDIAGLQELSASQPEYSTVSRRWSAS